MSSNSPINATNDIENIATVYVAGAAFDAGGATSETMTTLPTTETTEDH